VNGLLVDVCRLARMRHPFMVIEGVRSLERQKELLARGATRTLKSKHLIGHAVDLAPLLADGKTPSWSWPDYLPLAAVVKKAASELMVHVTWGGDWPKFRDGPHWELA